MTEISKPFNPAALQDLQIFLAISEAKTLSEAAQHLDLPLSVIDRTLKHLETSANLTLVRRDENGLELTELGRQYLLACVNVLEAHRRADDVLLNHHKQGLAAINISVPVVFAAHVLSPVIYEFFQRFPKVRVDLALYDSHWDREPKVGYDLWLRISPRGELRDHLKLLPGIRQGLFASPRYLANHTSPQDPRGLEQHVCLGYDRTGVLWPWHFSREGTKLEIQPDFDLVATDPFVLAHMAAEGAGIALLPLWLAHRLVLAGELVLLLAEWTVDPLVFCIYRGRHHYDPRVDAFVQLLETIVGTEKDPRCQDLSPSSFFV